MSIGSDGTHPLDHLARRWICEACEHEPATLPQIAKRLEGRGWAGYGTGSVDSTVKWLAREGWIKQVGHVTVRGKQSPLWLVEDHRKPDLHEAVRRNALGRVESGGEIVLIPAGALGPAATVLKDLRNPILWGMRVADASAACILLLDHTRSDAERDAVAEYLSRVGARRLRIDAILSLDSLRAYAAELVDVAAAAQLPATPGSGDPP